MRPIIDESSPERSRNVRHCCHTSFRVRISTVSVRSVTIGHDGGRVAASSYHSQLCPFIALQPSALNNNTINNKPRLKPGLKLSSDVSPYRRSLLRGCSLVDFHRRCAFCVRNYSTNASVHVTEHTRTHDEHCNIMLAAFTHSTLGPQTVLSLSHIPIAAATQLISLQKAAFAKGAAKPASTPSKSAKKAKDPGTNDTRAQKFLLALTPQNMGDLTLSEEQQADAAVRSKEYSRRKMAQHRRARLFLRCWHTELQCLVGQMACCLHIGNGNEI